MLFWTKICRFDGRIPETNSCIPQFGNAEKRGGQVCIYVAFFMHFSSDMIMSVNGRSAQ